LTTFYFFLLRTTKKRADVVACFTLIEKFAEHFNASHYCFLLANPDDFNLLRQLSRFRALHGP
jgi:hypothetical protein